MSFYPKASWSAVDPSIRSILPVPNNGDARSFSRYWSQRSRQAMVCLQLFMFLFPDVSIIWAITMAITITTAVLCCFLIITMSDWLAITILSVWIWKSHRILAQLFSTILGGDFHFYLGSYSTQMFRYIVPTAWLCSYIPFLLISWETGLFLGSCLVW